MKINGKVKEIAPCTITELLEALGLNQNRVVVEVNGVIVETRSFNEFRLMEQDSIEVISFVGGG